MTGTYRYRIQCNQSRSYLNHLVFTAKSLYMFRVSTTPIIRSTVTAASGTGHNIWATTFLQHWRKIVAQFYVLLMMGAVETRNM